MKKITLAALLLCTTIIGTAQNVPTTQSVLAKAYTQASKENKNVFVMFHASWCGWCKKMEASMNDSTTKKYFDESYIVVHLTVQESPANKQLENPGAAEYLNSLKGTTAGLPFFVVLNKKGELLGDSFIKKDENLGCPAAPEEVATFILLLKKSSKINDNGLAAITKRFLLNKPQK